MNEKYPGKGISLLQFPENFVVLDLETTGTEPSYDDIIEISCIRVENRNPVDTFTSLVNPGYAISEFISDYTGITTEMLAPAPKIETVLPDLKNFLGDSIVVGHNLAGFDSCFLYNNFARLNHVFSNSLVDTLLLSRLMVPALQHHRLCDMTEYFGIPVETSHRALADCETTLSLYNKLYDIAAASGNADEYLHQFKSNKSAKYARSLKELAADEGIEPDPDNFFFGKKILFTGALEKFTRKEAGKIVLNLGAEFTDAFKQDIDFLVIADASYKSETPSEKRAKAEKAILKGRDITILSESQFYDLVGEN